MSGFTTYKPNPNSTGRRAGPPIVKVVRGDRGTWIYFSVVIKRTLDILDGGTNFYSDKKAFVLAKVDQENNLLAFVNGKEDTPEALRVSAVGSSSQPYIAAGDLGEVYNIPSGRYQAERRYLDPADPEEAWVIDWTKDLGPGKYHPRKLREEAP